ncbi:MAG: c-type cytochrome [Bryobacteraceae bacterium]
MLKLSKTGTLVAFVAAGMCLLRAAAPDKGREAFEKRCAGCHALDKIKAGPPLQRVYGRKAGADPTFAYSDALKSAAVTWDEASLERWLADTDSVVRGNEMPFRLNDAQERRDIISFLKQLAGK